MVRCCFELLICLRFLAVDELSCSIWFGEARPINGCCCSRLHATYGQLREDGRGPGSIPRGRFGKILGVLAVSVLNHEGGRFDQGHLPGNIGVGHDCALGSFTIPTQIYPYSIHQFIYRLLTLSHSFNTRRAQQPLHSGCSVEQAAELTERRFARFSS